RAFDLEEDACGCFVEAEMRGAEAEAGTEFFVTEARAEAQSAESGGPVLGALDSGFAFHVVLVALRGAGWSWAFEGEPGAVPARGTRSGGGGGFYAHAQQALAVAEVGVWGVE